MEQKSLTKPKKSIRLIGLDLDGTVFDDRKRISDRTKRAIREAIEKGVAVVPATGRPLIGVPKEFTEIEGIKYALTANGAAIYDLEAGTCVYRDSLGAKLACQVVSRLQKYDVMVDVFIDGKGYVEEEDMEREGEYAMSEEIRQYIKKTRKTVPSLLEHIKEGSLEVDKITVNFKPAKGDKEQPLLWKLEVLKELEDFPQLVCVSGVPTNLEVTMATAHKGNGMRKLGELLGVEPGEIMVCGDSGNDREMLLAAGFGVAMANATQEVKEAADYITLSNEEDGVAVAIEKFVLGRAGQ